MPTSTRINPAFRADVGIRPYDYDALNNHLQYFRGIIWGLFPQKQPLCYDLFLFRCFDLVQLGIQLQQLFLGNLNTQHTAGHT